ncbi:MAG: TIGR00299 family protein, partial [Thermoprotei archaeon]
VDDVDGELLGRVREVLMRKGALDVYYYPAIAKKGRPGFMVQVLARPQDAWSLLEVLFTELGTLGVRVDLVDRVKLEREIREVIIRVDEVEERVRVKVAYDEEGRIVRVKPEHADLERIASRHGLPLRKVRELVLSRVMAELFL